MQPLDLRHERHRVRRASGAVLIAVLLATAAFASAARASVFDPQTFTLANGLQVVVVADRRVPVVSHMVWYKVGAADETPGLSGIAHLLEHLMFKGTHATPQGEFSRAISRNGGHENAFTSHDYTGYYQNIASDRLELVMTMEADRMANLMLTEAQVAPEKQVVLEERRQRVDNDPAAILAEEAQAARYLNHPYRRPIIGWEHEIAALKTEDVIAFYRRWYAPNNAVLVVTGDVSADQLRPLAERTYGRVAPVEVSPRIELREPQQRAQRRLSLTDPRVGQSAWTRAYPAPSYRTGAVDQAYPLQVLAEILGGGPTSRLYRSLVVDRPLAVYAGADYEPSARGPSDVVVYASPRPGVSLEQLEEAVLKVIDAVVADGLSDAEIDRARRKLLADIVYARDSFSTAAYLFGEALAIGQTIDDIKAWPDRIRAVDRPGVEAAARAVFAQPAVTSLLISSDPNEKAKPEGETEDPMGALDAAPRPSAGAAIR